MAVDSLRTHLVDELIDMLDAETQLTKALPKMAKSASAPLLKTAFTKHLAETRAQVTRLNAALRELGEKPRRKTCEAMKGLLTEGEELMNKAPAGALRDAVMITAAQKVEHYEIASYGTVCTYATVIGEGGVARLLARSLKEEKAADGKLTVIAERSVNEDAAEEWRSQEGMLEQSASWVGNTVEAASRQLKRSARQMSRAVGMSTPRRGNAGGRRRTAARRRSSGSRARA